VLGSAGGAAGAASSPPLHPIMAPATTKLLNTLHFVRLNFTEELLQWEWHGRSWWSSVRFSSPFDSLVLTLARPQWQRE
jgi:hypothetical protein